MTARNFSEDGAVGANTDGVGGGTFGTNTTTSGAPTTSAFGAPTPDSGGSGAISTGPHFSDSGGPTVDAAQTSTGNHGFWGEMNPTGLSFAEGGAIPDGDEDDPNATDPQGSALGASMQRSINDAMNTVKDALSYGRQLHGLGSGGGQQAARMPTQPGNQSESGLPRQPPAPGPQQPQFGKRTDAEGAIDDGGSDQTAAMPSVPFSETPKPQPMPGPLPPTSNPFGKRGQQADAGDDASPAIDTEEDA